MANLDHILTTGWDEVERQLGGGAPAGSSDVDEASLLDRRARVLGAGDRVAQLHRTDPHGIGQRHLDDRRRTAAATSTRTTTCRASATPTRG